MSDPQNFTHFILLLVFAIAAAYAVTMMIFGSRSNRILRVGLSGVISVVFVHAYLILTGEGPDQFVLISVLFMLIYGVVGSFLLDWVRLRFFEHRA